LLRCVSSICRSAVFAALVIITDCFGGVKVPQEAKEARKLDGPRRAHKNRRLHRRAEGFTLCN
jgi:hypothetical protein